VENHDEERSTEARELEVNCTGNNALTPTRARLNIWKASAGTITVMSRTDSLWSVIWFCEGSRRQKDCIREGINPYTPMARLGQAQISRPGP
jgi:hypothetical protein